MISRGAAPKDLNSMNLLALETSTRMGSIALLSDGRLLSEFQTGIRPSYSEMLLPLIEQVLHTAGMAIRDIDLFAVAQGPGSFTALRIGMSVMIGLAIATHKKIVTVPSLDGLAYNVCGSSHLICPMLDARRGELYYALYRFAEGGGLQRVTPYAVAPPERILAEIDETVVLLGDGIAAYGGRFVDALGERARVAPAHLLYPRAAAIGTLALQRLSDAHHDAAQESIMPLYVRAPDAEAK
jgi:tRNA threonylcarbamoyladenosine biosynthesis protein TsaB